MKLQEVSGWQIYCLHLPYLRCASHHSAFRSILCRFYFIHALLRSQSMTMHKVSDVRLQTAASVGAFFSSASHVRFHVQPDQTSSFFCQSTRPRHDVDLCGGDDAHVEARGKTDFPTKERIKPSFQFRDDGWHLKPHAAEIRLPLGLRERRPVPATVQWA